MKKVVNFGSIQTKILIGFSLVIFLVICLTVYNNMILSKNNQTVEGIVHRDFPIVLGDERIIRSIYDRIGSARGYLLTGDDVYKEYFNEASKLSDESHKEIEVRIPASGFQDIKQKTAEWDAYLMQYVFDEYDSGNEDQAYENLLIAGEQMKHLVADYESGAINRGNQIIALEEELLVDGKRTRMIVSAISVLITLIGIGIAIGTSRLISKPLQAATNRMALIAEGDFSEEPLHKQSNDEIGHLAVATNQMSDNMRILLDDIQNVSESVTVQSEGLTRSSFEIKEGSNKVAETMEDLAAGSETQAHRASNLATQMSSLTASIQEVNANGVFIQQSSEEVLQMTNEGASLMALSTEQMMRIDQIVFEAVEKVKGLDAHTREISELVSVIHDIADQTNLLALNATIEAARAGEHGKGFAVVADEVRKLAEQSSRSVTNITEIVHSIQNESVTVVSSLQTGYEEVEEGSEQIKVTGETFKEISAAVTDMASRIDTVTENLMSVQTDTEQMNDSIGEIAAISEESAAGIEQTSMTTRQISLAMEEVSTSVHELENMADELNGLVNRFKL